MVSDGKIIEQKCGISTYLFQCLQRGHWTKYWDSQDLAPPILWTSWHGGLWCFKRGSHASFCCGSHFFLFGIKAAPASSASIHPVSTLQNHSIFALRISGTPPTKRLELHNFFFLALSNLALTREWDGFWWLQCWLHSWRCFEGITPIQQPVGFIPLAVK